MSGVPVGRPQKILASQRRNKLSQTREFVTQFVIKLGEAKRRFSLGRVMAKLSNTSETTIAITFMVMNLSALVRQAF